MTLSFNRMFHATMRRWGRLAALCACAMSATAGADELAEALKQVPARIAYETWQDGNWELFTVRADGSEKANLTKTPTLNELYPHVSPDGTKICFVCDEGAGAGKIRNVYVMNLDGTDRKLVAANARDACWKKDDATIIAYLKGEVEQFTFTDYATRGTFFYDLKSGQHTPHPNNELMHLYNPCWTVMASGVWRRSMRAWATAMPSWRLRLIVGRYTI